MVVPATLELPLWLDDGTQWQWYNHLSSADSRTVPRRSGWSYDI